MFSNSFWITVSAIFFTGFFASVQLGIGYTYMMEIFSKKHRNLYSGLYMAIDSGVNIVSALYYGFVSKEWIYLTSTGYIIQVFTCIHSFFLPESPIWFINKNRAHKAIPSLEKIAKMNGRNLVFNPKDFKKPIS